MRVELIPIGTKVIIHFKRMIWTNFNKGEYEYVPMNMIGYINKIFLPGYLLHHRKLTEVTYSIQDIKDRNHGWIVQWRLVEKARY